ALPISRVWRWMLAGNSCGLQVGLLRRNHPARPTAALGEPFPLGSTLIPPDTRGPGALDSTSPEPLGSVFAVTWAMTTDNPPTSGTPPSARASSAQLPDDTSFATCCATRSPRE